MKNALDQIRRNFRAILDHVEKLSEDEINEASKQANLETRLDVIISVIENKRVGIKTCQTFYLPLM